MLGTLFLSVPLKAAVCRSCFSDAANSFVCELFFRPFGACSFPAVSPTACAVGCILSPLRGFSGAESTVPQGLWNEGLTRNPWRVLQNEKRRAHLLMGQLWVIVRERISG